MKSQTQGGNNSSSSRRSSSRQLYSSHQQSVDRSNNSWKTPPSPGSGGSGCFTASSPIPFYPSSTTATGVLAAPNTTSTSFLNDFQCHTATSAAVCTLPSPTTLFYSSVGHTPSNVVASMRQPTAVNLPTTTGERKIQSNSKQANRSVAAAVAPGLDSSYFSQFHDSVNASSPAIFAASSKATTFEQRPASNLSNIHSSSIGIITASQIEQSPAQRPSLALQRLSSLLMEGHHFQQSRTSNVVVAATNAVTTNTSNFVNGGRWQKMKTQQQSSTTSSKDSCNKNNSSNTFHPPDDKHRRDSQGQQHRAANRSSSNTSPTPKKHKPSDTATSFLVIQTLHDAEASPRRGGAGSLLFHADSRQLHTEGATTTVTAATSESRRKGKKTEKAPPLSLQLSFEELSTNTCSRTRQTLPAVSYKYFPVAAYKDSTLKSSNSNSNTASKPSAAAAAHRFSEQRQSLSLSQVHGGSFADSTRVIASTFNGRTTTSSQNSNNQQQMMTPNNYVSVSSSASNRQAKTAALAAAAVNSKSNNYQHLNSLINASSSRQSILLQHPRPQLLHPSPAQVFFNHVKERISVNRAKSRLDSSSSNNCSMGVSPKSKQQQQNMSRTLNISAIPLLLNSSTSSVTAVTPSTAVVSVTATPLNQVTPSASQKPTQFVRVSGQSATTTTVQGSQSSSGMTSTLNNNRGINPSSSSGLLDYSFLMQNIRVISEGRVGSAQNYHRNASLSPSASSFTVNSASKKSSAAAPAFYKGKAKPKKRNPGQKQDAASSLNLTTYTCSSKPHHGSSSISTAPPSVSTSKSFSHVGSSYQTRVSPKLISQSLTNPPTFSQQSIHLHYSHDHLETQLTAFLAQLEKQQPLSPVQYLTSLLALLEGIQKKTSLDKVVDTQSARIVECLKKIIAIPLSKLNAVAVRERQSSSEVVELKAFIKEQESIIQAMHVKEKKLLNLVVANSITPSSKGQLLLDDQRSSSKSPPCLDGLNLLLSPPYEQHFVESSNSSKAVSSSFNPWEMIELDRLNMFLQRAPPIEQGAEDLVVMSDRLSLTSKAQRKNRSKNSSIGGSCGHDGIPFFVSSQNPSEEGSSSRSNFSYNQDEQSSRTLDRIKGDDGLQRCSTKLNDLKMFLPSFGTFEADFEGSQQKRKDGDSFKRQAELHSSSQTDYQNQRYLVKNAREAERGEEEEEKVGSLLWNSTGSQQHAMDESSFFECSAEKSAEASDNESDMMSIGVNEEVQATKTQVQEGMKDKLKIDLCGLQQQTKVTGAATRSDQQMNFSKQPPHEFLDYHDEFMEKFDDFSKSWRDAIRAEKRYDIKSTANTAITTTN